MAATLATARQWATAELFDAAAWARLDALAALIPAPLTDRFYLECHLGTEAPRADLIVGVAESGREILAGRNPAISLGPRSQATNVWSLLGELCRDWSDGRLLSGESLRRLWLEFDLEIGTPLPERLPRPRIFVDWKRPVAADIASKTLDDLLAPRSSGLLAGSSSSGLLRNFRSCLERLPPTAALFSVGLFPSPEGLQMRLCIRAATAALPAYLEAVAWPGPVEDLRRLLADLRTPETARLHLDLGTSVEPKIGLEYRVGLLGRREPGKNGRLERLQELGLCPPQKRRALDAWPGAGVATLPHELWPSVVVRWLNHVKVTYHPRQGLAAKAYLCHGHSPHVARGSRQ